MTACDLAEIRKELRANGFAVREGKLADFQRESATQGWTLLQQKDGVTTMQLRPMATKEAPPRTLSALHGMGAQPLHTDGAHLSLDP